MQQSQLFSQRCPYQSVVHHLAHCYSAGIRNRHMLKINDGNLSYNFNFAATMPSIRDFLVTGLVTKIDDVSYMLHNIRFCTMGRTCMYYMGLVAKKPVFGGLQTTKAQTSLRIRQTDQRLCYSLIGKYHF